MIVRNPLLPFPLQWWATSHEDKHITDSANDDIRVHNANVDHNLRHLSLQLVPKNLFYTNVFQK